ncbi:Crp/Fnr family transcriptional regulator [Fusibacter sp. JL298sf-3]
MYNPELTDLISMNTVFSKHLKETTAYPAHIKLPVALTEDHPIFYLASGSVTISVTMPNGKWIPLQFVEPNAFFGLCQGQIIGEFISYETAAPSKIAVMEEPAFTELLCQDAHLFHAFWRFLKAQHQFLTEKVILFSIQNNRQRMAYFFLQEIYRQRCNPIWVTMSKTCTLASLGMSRGSFYREFNALIKEGYICPVGAHRYKCNPKLLFDILST